MVLDVKAYTAQRVTYDLSVEGLHTYHVGAGDAAVLAHNINNPVACTVSGRHDVYDIPGGSSGGHGAGETIPPALLGSYDIGVNASPGSTPSRITSGSTRRSMAGQGRRSKRHQGERESLKAVLAGVERIESGEVNIETAVGTYAEVGYEVTENLSEFLKNYGEIVVGRTYSATGEKMVLTVALEEEAMDVYPPNGRSYSRRLGMRAVPIGIALETEENVLLLENGDIVFAGDADIQRIGPGFEEAVKAFVSSSWDKTFS
ncbi:hypothetical protein E6R18_31650 [Streptomyces sp. A1277]|uniref:SUKH-3 domain-containing protein n=1 Tax=Streptomyces sp. A1277 TaxID=2563103 RepID=UPI0010A22F84|nr:SUKH-3 domain-containing protein [Streptomyces sp. A1277]THA23007.1 hypothetical protein E6R18_31650 [Streptomyces sp. A1277]